MSDEYVYDEESGEWLPASEIAARHLVEAGAVVALPISDPGMDLRDLEVQTLAGRSLPVAVQAFMDLLKERLPGRW